MNGNGLIAAFAPMVLFIGIFYFIIIRPQKRQEREVTSMRNSLKVGDEIVTIGGIIGRIVKVKDKEISIEVGADKTRFNMEIWSVREIRKPSNESQSKKEDKSKEE